jgi:threonyl-tRNA synthetase
MQKKIRNAQMQKVPYMLIAGEEDQLAGKVSIRYRNGDQKNGIAVVDAIAEIQKAIRDRKQV